MTKQENNPEETGQVDYIIIYKATQLNGKEHPNLASELIDDREAKHNYDYDPNENGARTSLTSESGYMMRFAKDDSYKPLNAFDILTLPQSTSYPAPQSALESLPATLRAELEQKGILQIRCMYHEGKMYGAKLGWEETESVEPPEWFAKLIGEGVSPVAALDYYIVEIAGDGDTEENHTVDTWAKERGVSVEAIKKSLRDVRTKLDIDPDDS